MTDAATRRAQEFASALSDVPVESTSRNFTWAKLGLVVQIVGVAMTLIALVLSQTTSNPLEQSTCISLGLSGLALVGLGGALFLRYSFGQFLRFWLLRLSAELQHSTGTTAPTASANIPRGSDR
jgi:hypothetical protein